jgi:hypothetical protein
VDRGGFRWGAWVTWHDLESETIESITDGVGPLALSVDQSQVAFARYTCEPRENVPNCTGITILQFEVGEKVELAFPPSFQPVQRSSRTVLGICWSENGDELFAVDGWGNLWAWKLSEPESAPVILDSLHLSYQGGWGWRGVEPGIELLIDAEGSIHFKSPLGNYESISVTWQRSADTHEWVRMSELIEEVDNTAPLASENERPIEFQSLNARFTLADNLDDLTVTDTETGQITSLPIGPEIVRGEDE